MNKKLTLIALALYAMLGGQLRAESYSCGAIYPGEVYCPPGMICAFAAPTCIMDIGVIGGSSITEELYDLKIPANAFVKVSLNKANKLPFSQYPALGKDLAFELAATKGQFTGIPFKIVIRTEIPNEKFISKIERGIQTLTDEAQITGAKKLVATLRNLKTANKGVNAVYRAVHSLGETKYKLYYVRIPGEKPGYIIARPDGNLEFHEADPKQKNKELVTVIDTGRLMK